MNILLLGQPMDVDAASEFQESNPGSEIPIAIVLYDASDEDQHLDFISQPDSDRLVSISQVSQQIVSNSSICPSSNIVSNSNSEPQPFNPSAHILQDSDKGSDSNNDSEFILDEENDEIPEKPFVSPFHK